MSVRPFDWRDLPTLYRYRHRSIYLDTALVLTRGPLLLPGAFLSTLTPAMGVETVVYEKKGTRKPVIIGQVIHAKNSPFAHLTFLAPDHALDSPDLITLLDSLVVHSGESGVFHLIAEVDEKNQAFEALRRSSFAIYGRQRIWQFNGLPGAAYTIKESTGKAQSFAWREAVSTDLVAIRSLYNDLVPGLVQQVEPFSLSQKPTGLVCEQNGGLLAYVDVVYGGRGIWAQPFIHPDVDEVNGKLVSLIQTLNNRRSKPVYLCVRSYQAWLETVLEELGAEAGPRQAVMVKHMAVPIRAARSISVPAMESGQPEISTPIARTENRT